VYKKSSFTQCRKATLITIAIMFFCHIESISSDTPSFECLAAYSKLKGLSEPEFDSVTYDSKRPECVAAIKKFSDKIRGDIIEKMAEVASDKKQTDCINGKFVNDDTFVNNIIKGEALASIDTKEKSAKLSAVEGFAEEYITSAISACLSY
jgi:hypothetical protein